MLVVIAIASLLTALAVPGLVGWLPRYRLNSAAGALNELLQQARMRAIKENKRVVVLFDPDGDGKLEEDYLAFVDDMSGGESEWTWEPETEPLVGRKTLPKGVRLGGSMPPGQRLRFNSRGLLCGVNCRIDLRNAHEKTKRITVYTSGNTRVR
jgi:type IV fimbrial biogenesis protein FimT